MMPPDGTRLDPEWSCDNGRRIAGTSHQLLRALMPVLYQDCCVRMQGAVSLVCTFWAVPVSWRE